MLHRQQYTRHIVRPVGKYGKIYCLQGIKYFVYIAYITIFYLFCTLYVLTHLSLVTSEICFRGLQLLCELPPEAISVVWLFGYMGQIAIACTGIEVPPDDPAYVYHPSRISKIMKHLYWGFLSVLSAIFGILLASATYSSFHTGEILPPFTYIVLALCVYVPFRYYRKWRSEK